MSRSKLFSTDVEKKEESFSKLNSTFEYEIKDIPDEILLTIFSFLEKPIHLALAGLVCKHWYEVTNDNYLWLNFIRAEYREKCIASGSSVKDFYKNTIEARFDTYYLIGKSVKTWDCSWGGYVINVDKKLLLESFPKDERLQIFYSQENAIKSADMYTKDEEAALDDWSNIYNYHPVFTIQINIDKHRNKNRIKSQLECFEIHNSQVTKLYSLFYKKASSQYLKTSQNDEEHYVIDLNNEKEQKDEQKKGWSCLIQ